MTPFVLPTGAHFRPPGPPAFDSARYAEDYASARGNTVTENARLFALLNVAMADAAIAAWDAKSVFHSWRPVTAIRGGDLDGNTATVAEPVALSRYGRDPSPAFE